MTNAPWRLNSSSPGISRNLELQHHQEIHLKKIILFERVWQHDSYPIHSSNPQHKSTLRCFFDFHCVKEHFLFFRLHHIVLYNNDIKRFFPLDLLSPKQYRQPENGRKIHDFSALIRKKCLRLNSN